MKQIELCIKPYGDENGEVQSVGVTFHIQGLTIEKDGMLAFLWESIAGIPCTEFSEEPKADDTKGELELYQKLAKDPTGFMKKVWHVTRNTCGEISLSYRFLPRDLTDVKRAHPIFDACCEEGGILFSGVSCLLELPDGEYRIHTTWDLSEMPERAVAVAANKAEYTGNPESYAFSLYAAGDVKCASDDSGKYNVYWLSEPLPDQENVVNGTIELLKGLCRFFHDEDISYNVFFRKDPFDISNSGTSFDCCFAYGYSDAMPLSMNVALNTIAHEITHNWPAMESIQGEGDWFTEGTAEYYSMVIPYRCGIIDLDQFAEELTEKCFNYFSNSYIRKPYQEGYQHAWKDREAQRLPYGRGTVYFAETERRIREKSNGQHSIDELVLKMVAKRKAGTMPKIEDWENLIREELGEEEVTFLHKFLNGEIVLEPDEQWFDGKFCVSRGTYGSAKTKVDEHAVIWKKRGNH